MKAILIVLLAVVSVSLAVDWQQANFTLNHHGIPPPGPAKRGARTPVWGTIQQKLDHFNANDQRTWSMRYIYNNQFWRAGGPIFIMVGAEWTIDPGWLQSGLMYDMAQQHGGYMFYTEHRYYGKSFPTNDLSSNNLQYLTTDLALADVAYFIQYMKSIMPDLANSKVVIVGGSYGGNMAIWLREKYPNLVHAAHSSSAPVLAKVDFTDYHDVVKTALGSSCSAVIQKGVDQIRSYLQTSAGISKVQKDFNICQPISNADALNYWYFFFTIANTFAGQIQNANSNTVNEICSVLLNTNLGTEYDRLARATATNGCKPDYQNFVAYFQQTGLDLGDSRQWIYQTCTQYGYFQTSPYENSLYRSTLPADMYHQYCYDIFGSAFTKQRTYDGVARTNSVYGGYNPQVTRVVSTHGSIDPWHSIGLKSSPNDEAPVILIKGASHCNDLGSISSWDSQDLQNAKQLVKDWINYWLSLP